MKKLSSFAVAVLLLLSFGVSGLLYVCYDIAQYYDKTEAQRNIMSNEHLQTIKLSLKEFNSKKENNEVWADGKLYDISAYTIVNDTVIISAFHDEQEESLVNSITDSFDPFNSSVSDHNTVHIYKHHVHPPADGKVLVARYSIHFTGIYNNSSLLSQYLEYSSNSISAIIKPPPKRFVC